MKVSGLSNDEKRSLADVGYAVRRATITADECKEMLCQLLELKQRNSFKARATITEFRAWSVERSSDLVRRFMTGPIVSELKHEINQEPQLTVFNHIWRGDGPGSGGGWHRDTRFRPQYKIILYLSDVLPGMGEFWYVPGSHKLTSPFTVTAVRDVFTKPRYDAFAGILTKYKEPICGNAGDAIIVNTRGIHVGSKVEFGERYALTIYFDNGVVVTPN